MSVIECKGFGGFGVFFSKDQILEFLKKDELFGEQRMVLSRSNHESDGLGATGAAGAAGPAGPYSVIKDILLKQINNLDDKIGFKFLDSRTEYDKEVAGLSTAMSLLPDNDKYWKRIGFHIENEEGNEDENICFFQCRNPRGAVKAVSATSLHLVCMTVLDSIQIVKDTLRSTTDVDEFNNMALHQVVTPLLQQLTNLHASGIYHRDIKPANIMYNTASKRAVFIDFGLATSELKMGSGTLGYMSPGYYIISKYLTRITNKSLNENKSDIKLKEYICISTDPYLNYNSFFVYRSLQTYIEYIESLWVVFNVDQLKKTIIKHNDCFALGLSIQQICGCLIPYSEETRQKFIKFEEANANIAPYKFAKSPTDNNYTLKSLDSSEWKSLVDLEAKVFGTKLGGGSSRQGRRNIGKKYVLGKERVVFKREGCGNALYLVFHKKVVPLKDARKLEREIKAIKRDNLYKQVPKG